MVLNRPSFRRVDESRALSAARAACDKESNVNGIGALERLLLD